MSEPGHVPSESPVGGEDTPADRARRRSVRIGAAFLLSAVVLGGLIVATGPFRVWSGQRVRVDFVYAGPIKPGASIRVAGIVVGAVERVDLLAGTDPEAGPDKMVRVTARVDDAARPVLTDAARFYVTTLGVLGEHYLDIEPRPGGRPLTDGARVDGVTLARADLLLPRAAGLLEAVSALAPTSAEGQDLVRALARLAIRLDEALEADAPLAADLSAVLSDARALLRAVAVGIGDGAELRRLMSRLPSAVDRADRLAGRLEDADLAATLTDLRATLGRIDAVLARVDGSPLADPAVQQALRLDLARALVSVDAFARRGERLLGLVEEKRGAAGRLFHDEAVADDLKAVLHGLRESPLRFLVGPREPAR